LPNSPTAPLLPPEAEHATTGVHYTGVLSGDDPAWFGFVRTAALFEFAALILTGLSGLIVLSGCKTITSGFGTSGQVG
jgi:hypothetical protein